MGLKVHYGIYQFYSHLTSTMQSNLIIVVNQILLDFPHREIASFSSSWQFVLPLLIFQITQLINSVGAM